MNSIRFRVILLAGWFLSLFFINQGLAPTVMSHTTIVLVLIMTILGLVTSRKPGIPIWGILAFPIISLLVIDLLTGKLSEMLGISMAIMESGIIMITTFLARWVSAGLGEFENAVVQITLGQRENSPQTSESGHDSIYQEVRRARNHQRPLAILSIAVEEKSIEPAVEKMVQEIQRSMIKQYKLQGLSKLLCDELEKCSVIVRDCDNFLIVLPETVPEELPIVVGRLRQKAFDQVGVELKVGVATLPQDSNTFEGLVITATQAMESDEVRQPCTVLDHSPIEHQSN